MQSIIIKKGGDCFHVYVTSKGGSEPFEFFSSHRSLEEAKMVTSNLMKFFEVTTILAHNEYIVQEHKKD